ncbi:MAG: histidine phosphatase family protein [Chloroflexi bacterium]|nr:histidine phosphatase family protein [Chloroflexota bacterium]
MAKFILVRHGQTEWNRVERFRGRVDVPLNETGIRQAQAAAERLAEMSISAVFSSPLSRAHKTAEIIALRLGLPVQVAEGLIDFNYGDWQGLSPEEAAANYPEIYPQWLDSPDKARIPGGESLDDVRSRAMDAILELAVRFPDQTVVLVSHKVVCKIVMLALLGADNARFWAVEQDNAAINVFECGERGVFIVLTMNDTCHLEGGAL